MSNPGNLDPALYSKEQQKLAKRLFNKMSDNNDLYLFDYIFRIRFLLEGGIREVMQKVKTPEDALFQPINQFYKNLQDTLATYHGLKFIKELHISNFSVTFDSGFNQWFDAVFQQLQKEDDDEESFKIVSQYIIAGLAYIRTPEVWPPYKTEGEAFVARIKKIVDIFPPFLESLPELEGLEEFKIALSNAVTIIKAPFDEEFMKKIQESSLQAAQQAKAQDSMEEALAEKE